MNNLKIKVALVDDHHIFRTGLRTAIERYDDFNVIIDLSSGEELINWLKTCKDQPDVVMMDMKMTGMDGAQTTGIVREKYRDIKIIGLSVYESHFHVLNMFKAGAGGYLLKDSLPEEIADAIREVHHNDYYFSSHISLKLLKSILDKDLVILNKGKNKEKNKDELSESEVILLRYICGEHTNAEISNLMNLGLKTIENYRNKLLQKTNSRNTAGLVMYAIKKGYLVI
jgi:DNA-binding NarL/FixJ family response regulator